MLIITQNNGIGCRGGNKRRLLGGTKGDSRSASRKGSNSRPLGQALRRPERSGGRRKGWPNRLTPLFLNQTLEAFNAGQLDATTAAQELNVSRAHLYRLRTRWLRQPSAFRAQLSGGSHRPDWPAKVDLFLESFLPLQRPPNYQLVADEL